MDNQFEEKGSSPSGSNANSAATMFHPPESKEENALRAVRSNHSDSSESSVAEEEQKETGPQRFGHKCMDFYSPLGNNYL